jgi:predicted enzyme related to lactoylglutathione lyase
VPGINGGILPNGDKVRSTTNTIQVDSVDVAAVAVKNAGGKQLSPKNSIPGIGYFAYCEDTEGNMFGMMQSDVNAK